MFKKFPAAIALLTLLLPFSQSYSQQPSPSASASPAATATPDKTDYSSLPPAKIIDKLQEKIIAWQEDVINGMRAQVILPNLYREMATVAVDADGGKVKDQKMLDLLTKYGVGVSTKDGKKMNTPSTASAIPAVPVESVPFIEIKEGATREDKARIRGLLEKGQALVDSVNGYKKVIASLQAVIVDVLQLAKSDDGAQTVVDKFHIKQQFPIPSPTP